MRMWVVRCLIITGALSVLATAQAAQSKSSACTFDDGQQIAVRYTSASQDAKLRDGEVWSPGNSPMYFFTSAPLSVGQFQIPVGAYSMFVVPEKDHWTLVVNKNVGTGSKYDEHQDLLRVPMQLGVLGNAQPFTIFFGHMAPKQCNMRMYEGKIGAWEEFKEH